MEALLSLTGLFVYFIVFIYFPKMIKVIGYLALATTVMENINNSNY